ncbi:hypothetical protein HHI36_001898 [Cryptolaemus montrouzieri]
MHVESDSSNGNFEEEIYSFRQSTHRLKRLSSNLNRIERRTALSLRPISRKCYADDTHSPLTFNSDEGRKTYPKRKRVVRFKNTSWLADDQMHKVGYPNLNPIPYSEEDSRDVPENDTSKETRRTTRQTNTTSDNKNRVTKTSKYVYDYDDSDQRTQNDSIHLRRSSRELRSKRSSNDQEKDESMGMRCLRSQCPQVKEEIDRENKLSLNNLDDTSKDIIDDSNKEEDADADKKKTTANQDSSDSDAPLKLPRNNNRTTSPNKQFRLPVPRTRKVSSSSDSTVEEKQQHRRMRKKPVPPEGNSRPYLFRQRPPKPPAQPNREDFSMPGTSRNAMNLARKRHYKRVRRSSSSSSDSSEESVRTYSKTPKSPHSKNEQRMKRKSVAGGSNIIPIGPETLDGTVRFDSIGGLDSHIQCLKEMILLPMMYPEVFQQFHIKPPRGVLFHGPPGTGKTLIARALANECSFGKKKVSFFMRKGADLLSKWIGESEKQLRLLFEQASEMKPSIIFFDELDGLIPVRSSRNDQIHASIVSTLLALMDGLDDRGEIIVIGATNRIDAIDPAFRRPGRFDRELLFPLPARKEREEILNVHVSQWLKPPNSQLMSYLAEQAVGYCGSDLRALCSEAVIQSFRRTYPQVYNSQHKLLLKPEEVNVQKLDFMRAKSILTPAAYRTNQCVSRKLLPILEPLLSDYMKNILATLDATFPHGVHEKLARVKLSANIRPAQILLVGEGSGHGQTEHLAPAIIYRMEHIQCYTLNLATLYKESNRSSEEVTLQLFTEARRNVPSVIYLPCIDKFWNLVSETTKAILLDQLSQMDPHVPILIFVTSDTLYKELPERVKKLFSTYRKEVFQISAPSAEQRKNFFKPLIMENSMKPVRLPRQKTRTPPPLPKAPTPPPSPISEEQLKKLYEKEEHTLRELRIFLRDMCRKLAQNKMFFMFTKPVDIEEVPDYPTIIKQPMDLETMMMKVDFHRYECAKDFLSDIELIVQNALEYNPARTSVDKQIRHRACSLRDYAYTLIKTEMDSDFEEKCQDIAKSRKGRQRKVKHLPEYLVTPDIASCLDELEEKDSEKTIVVNRKSEPCPISKVTPLRKRKAGSWQKGFVKSNKRKKKEKMSLDNEEEEKKAAERSSGDEFKENNPQLDVTKIDTSLDEENNRHSINGNCEMSNKVFNDSLPMTPSRPEISSWQSPKRRLSDMMSPSELLEDPLYFDDVDQAMNESGELLVTKVPIECSMHELEMVLDQIVKLTAGYTLHSLLDLHNQLSKIVRRYLRTYSRTNLPKELQKS